MEHFMEYIKYSTKQLNNEIQREAFDLGVLLAA
jgi:hypothetical protein